MARKAFMAIACIALTGCLYGCAVNHVFRVGSAVVRIWSGVIVTRDLVTVNEEALLEYEEGVEGQEHEGEPPDAPSS